LSHRSATPSETVHRKVHYIDKLDANDSYGTRVGGASNRCRSANSCPPKRGVPHIASTLLVAVANAMAFAGCVGTPETKPDIALIVIDTLRADRLGAYGYGKPTSPTIDRLAANALVYENATATAPFTMPSVAAMMTGLYGDRVGVHNHSPKDRLIEPAQTLAEIASHAGYRTAAVVSNPWLARRGSGFEQGFDEYATRRTLDVGNTRPSASTIVDRALAMLDRSDQRPVLIWTHFIDTHMPYTPPPELAQAFGNATGTSRIIEDFNAEQADRQAIYFESDYADSDLDATRQLYDAAIRYVDNEIARLLDGWSSRRARARITVIVSDHGESLGDHGLFFAHDFTLFEELVRVPLIIAGTGDRPARIRTAVSLVDLLATLCNEMHATCPADLDGRPLPRSDHTSTPRAVFAAGPPKRARYGRDPWTKKRGLEGRWTMTKRGGTKIIDIPRLGGSRHLGFDLEDDPGELNDVYQSHKHTELQILLGNWRVEMLAAARIEHATETPTLAPDTREALRRLGYLD